MVFASNDIQFGMTSNSRSMATGYALWQFDGSTWELRKDASAPGAVPGNAPRRAGLFAGQIRAMPSIVPPVDATSPEGLTEIVAPATVEQ